MGNDDQELKDIFMEEATDLVASVSVTLRAWENDLHDLKKISDVKRDLHTLKGSARMVGFSTLGTLTHELETLCEAVAKNQISIDKSVFDLICFGHDQLSLMVECLKKNETPPEVTDIIEKFHAYLPTAEAVVPKKTKEQQATPIESPKNPIGHAVEIVRVRADMLEKLNSLSTESSMVRIGLEQKITVLNSGLLEMKQCVKRFEWQLNDLNIELEQNQDIRHKWFPLEQLINSLRETNVDLDNINKELFGSCTQMENDALRQARINAELQQRLTTTRLVPFESIVPRLSRIARQISSEINKKVDFKVIQSQGDMDRTVLEQLVPSLEHILRNAIDHGIESFSDRMKNKKSEVGKIEVRFVRSGSTIAIEVQDDGAGISPDIIRRKAIHLGLMKANSVVSDEEVIRYILEPGFSTREEVTEISGRGVGMDVVSTAVKEMGGNLTIRSEVGVGTKITIRFPFTISLNRILIFSMQNQLLGMLLSNVESVSSINVKALKESTVKLENKIYSLVYLGELLNAEQKQFRAPKKNTIPILLCGDVEYPTAIAVDSVLYSRDLVVQALGPQFKLRNEYVGATTLGDGRIVFVLDPHHLSMNAKALKGSLSNNDEVMATPEVSEKIKFMKPALILVVDDSMSARAVTERLLEHNHFQVITATDGIDALEKIAQTIPDLIVSDIDMRGMDGLEFAMSLQQDPQYKDIPLVMVTSRPHEHRKRIEELKIAHVLEKPYQEEEFLMLINQLLKKNR